MVGLNYGAPGQAFRISAQARREAGARRAVDDVCTLAEQLDCAESADRWLGYPAQKYAVHPSQVYTLLGDPRAAYRAQNGALALTTSPSVMTRALIAMDTAACPRADGNPRRGRRDGGRRLRPAAACLPDRTGPVHSRARLLHQHLHV
ncbi:hypothetical protein ACIRQY_23145 [Streptomyces sp. NPDC101490]|uniref:hypothetical protein n=1 Tax=Streptomyces sp. NPDC101490 TaxID=3366143 RepID=UPI003830E31E